MRHFLSCSDNLYLHWALTCLRAADLIQTACRTALCSPRKVARWPATLSGHEHTCAQWKLCLESSSSPSRRLTLWPKPSAVCPAEWPLAATDTHHHHHQPPLLLFGWSYITQFCLLPRVVSDVWTLLVEMRQGSVRTEIALRVRSFIFISTCVVFINTRTCN